MVITSCICDVQVHSILRYIKKIGKHTVNTRVTMLMFLFGFNRWLRCSVYTFLASDIISNVMQQRP